jgi:ribosomal-protein-alanine N-acetyltransferase
MMTPLALEHFADLKALMGDPGVRAVYGEGRDRADRVLGWIEYDAALRARGIPGMHALNTDDGAFVGLCGLLEQTVDGVTALEVAYLLRDRARGNGYATEAARFWRDQAFREFGVQRVTSLIWVENFRSMAVAERNGMHCERRTTFRDMPIHLYAIERAEWEIVRARESARPSASS